MRFLALNLELIGLTVAVLCSCLFSICFCRWCVGKVLKFRKRKQKQKQKARCRPVANQQNRNPPVTIYNHHYSHQTAPTPPTPYLPSAPVNDTSALETLPESLVTNFVDFEQNLSSNLIELPPSYDEYMKTIQRTE